MTNIKTKKNKKTYIVSRETLHFFTKLKRYVYYATVETDRFTFKDPEFIERLDKWFFEKDGLYDLLIGVVMFDPTHIKARKFVLDHIIPYTQWCYWLKRRVLLRGIFGWGACLRGDIYEGYQDICRYFDGMFTVENKRDIMEIELTGCDMMIFYNLCFMLKKYAD